jgi:hypothetical protein
MKYSLILAVIPVVVWFLIPHRDSDAEILTQKLVPTETIRPPPGPKYPDNSFEDRWFPPSPPKRVKTINVRVEEPDDRQVPAQSVVGIPKRSDTTDRDVHIRSTKRRNVRYAYRDICVRHNMRRVITNNGRSWRCRR